MSCSMMIDGRSSSIPDEDDVDADDVTPADKGRDEEDDDDDGGNGGGGGGGGGDGGGCSDEEVAADVCKPAVSSTNRA